MTTARAADRPAARLHAAPLTGRGWVGTGGNALSLESLRGKFVLLDFWTFCCANCLHVLDELRELETRFADVLVIVGVHSPKFPHEADRDALLAAVERYGITHPVLDDPTLSTWNAYAARAWPTLTLIDPEGYIVAQMSGEGHAPGLQSLLEELLPPHEAAGTLHRGAGPFVPPEPAAGALRFPGKICALPDGTLLVSDSTHHQIVQLESDLVTERRRFGTGSRGSVDGDADTCSFSEPQGVLALPPDVAARVGYDAVVADTVNHALRGVRIDDGTVVTVAGTGGQLRERSGSGPALSQDLSSPWDLAWFDGAIWVAMAGIHQLWRFDPAAGTIAAQVGTSVEGMRDGPAPAAHLAQPSGLAASADGTRMWFVDSETSALRHLTDAAEAPRRLRVATDIGAGLFDFGHVDGPAADARLQHPLGVTELPDGSVAICDTYNGAIRRFDPATAQVSTLATGLAEPSDAIVEPGPDDPVLVVVESAAHRLVRVPIPAVARRIDGGARKTARAATPLYSSGVTVTVEFTPPAGQKLDDRFGDPTRLDISCTPPDLLVAGSGAAQGLSRILAFAPGRTGGVLHISAQAAACDGDPATGEVPEFAACHLYQQDWGIPITLDTPGATDLTLPLRSV